MGSELAVAWTPTYRFFDTKSISVNTVCTCVFPVVSKISLLY